MDRTAPPAAADVRRMISVVMAGNERAQLMHRLHCVLLVAEGCTSQAVADWFGVDRRTVQRWVHDVHARGIEGLTPVQPGGRPSTLSIEQLQRIRCELCRPPAQLGYLENHWSGKRLAGHLGDHYGVSISVRSCQRLIAACRKKHASK